MKNTLFFQATGYITNADLLPSVIYVLSDEVFNFSGGVVLQGLRVTCLPNLSEVSLQREVVVRVEEVIMLLLDNTGGL